MIRTGFFTVIAVFAACSARENGPQGRSVGGEAGAEACSDGRDNDADGLTDCEARACQELATCMMSSGDGGSDRARGDVVRPPPGDGGDDDCRTPIDVVFVIDVSTSMADEIENVRAGMDSIWATAERLTDNPQFGMVVFVDDVAVVSGCTPFASVDAMRTEFATWREFTATNAQPGGSLSSNSDCAENSLDALYAAASTCPWRPSTTHIAIHVTDDTFGEAGDMLSFDIPVARDYGETVNALREHQVRVGSFAAPGAGEYCGAGSSPDTGQGFHAPYRGMPSIPEATGGQAWDIREVRAGTLDMAEAINALIESEQCMVY